ncbi:cytidylate kinase family protein [Saccharopolyspora phatthalungensis]|uniref:Cytidylate kinase n=1 Tax=Saccharopolyspora phatthalungensis TaxID=664693 RepID=A0A840QDA8_9PSEU|nr:cytidylate kinase-like family protein [Saccharopolyspora phatthalungensis]MBB5154933.1 cytidylate kinase [Saccharopolyspora phatthalungensis]
MAIAGLTAAGKTTHARLLADALGYRYVSATGILLELLGIESDTGRAWFDHQERIRKARSAGDVDAELDRRLIQLATEEDGLVLDSWAIAWTCRVPMVRLWFESDALSRTWKCFVSQGESPEHDLDGCLRIIEDKDTSTRDLFLQHHGFDLFLDREIFDAILDNTHLIHRPTRRAADAGIAAFAPVVQAVVESLLSDRQGDLASAALNWTNDQRSCLVHVRRKRGDDPS